MRTRQVVLTCEHATWRVPADLRAVLPAQRAGRRSHRAWDPGALELARVLGERLGREVLAPRVSRLVVDANRSESNWRRLPASVRALPAEQRERIVARHWRPHRQGVLAAVERVLARDGRVLVLSVHSFTPVWKGRRRSVDLGWLFDPARARERALCERWRARLGVLEPDLRLRFNAPYRGTADGLTTALRAQRGPDRLLGIELEVSQRFPRGRRARWRGLQANLAESLAALLPEV